MSSTWDLVVVGAGPAGASTALGALRADPGLRVLLLDRQDFPRDKSCGDGIAPHVFDALASVGVHDAADGWVPLRELELARERERVRRPLRRPVWVIPRQVFDARLVQHATQAGAVLLRHRVRDVRVTSGGVLLDDQFQGRVVVAADGAHSVVRPAVGLPPVRRRALAIRGYAPTPPTGRGKQLIVYGDRRQPSYAWAFDRGDGTSNVGYGELVGADHDPPSRALLLGELERLVPGTVDAGGQWRAHHLPLSQWRWEQPEGRVLLTGDAAGLVNPMTGEGIYYAVASGILAGRAAASALGAATPAAAGAGHRTAVRRLLARHLRHTFLTSRLSAVPRVVDAGIRAAARDQRVFDDLVEIGLGQGVLTPRLAGGLMRGLVTRTPDPHPTVVP
ncbi:MAG TPA: NAD(P)/FAD-dependent oxidoreductase [Nocardioidaceae bacterium]|nr:NAD(P)/FAD-dependent oxidoreductase [Nocardioidaceae bacterium]